MNIKRVLELLVEARAAGTTFQLLDGKKIRTAAIPKGLPCPICPVNVARLQTSNVCNNPRWAGLDGNALGMDEVSYLNTIYAADYPEDARPKIRNLRRMLLKACGLNDAYEEHLVMYGDPSEPRPKGTISCKTT